jgi:hypothetical protein
MSQHSVLHTRLPVVRANAYRSLKSEDTYPRLSIHSVFETIKKYTHNHRIRVLLFSAVQHLPSDASSAQPFVTARHKSHPRSSLLALRRTNKCMYIHEHDRKQIDFHKRPTKNHPVSQVLNDLSLYTVRRPTWKRRRRFVDSSLNITRLSIYNGSRWRTREPP